MKLLPLTQSSLILQPLLMDPHWPNFSVAETPWSVMHMASRAPSNSSTLINTLADNIRNRGAMHTLISDGGSYEISKKVIDLLRSLFIPDYQSEPYHLHQNMAENQWGTAKGWVNKIMNSSGCPPSAWLLCLQYVCVLLNHMSSSCPGWPPSPPCPDRTDSRHQFSTELTLMNPPPIFLPLPMKGKATGLVSLTMLVTILPGKFSPRIPTTLSSDLLSGVPITPPLIFVMSCFQGRAIFLTPTLSLMKNHQTSLTRIPLVSVRV